MVKKEIGLFFLEISKRHNKFVRYSIQLQFDLKQAIVASTEFSQKNDFISSSFVAFSV